MDLERFIAALGVAEVVNAAPGTAVRELAYDTRAVVPGTLFFCVRGAHARRARVRADGRGARRGALVVEQPARRARCRSSSCPTCARAMPAGRDALLRRPDARARRRRDHRHERQDDVRVPAARDPRGRRAAQPGCSRTSSGASAASRARPGSTRRRRSTCSGSSAQMARRRRHGLRDGGDLDRAGAGPARGDALRGARLHEPDAGSPRLPRLDGGVLRGEARAVRAGRARRDQRRRRVRAAARGRAARRDHVRRRRPRARRDRLPLPRAVQPRERDRRRARGARARRRATTRSGAGSSRSPAFPAASSRSTRASRSR